MSPELQEACLAAVALKRVADQAHTEWLKAVDRAIEMADRQSPGLADDLLAGRLNINPDVVRRHRNRSRR